jgi:hypothetical protein
MEVDRKSPEPSQSGLSFRSGLLALMRRFVLSALITNDVEVWSSPKFDARRRPGTYQAAPARER